MTRTQLNYVTDAVAFVGFLVLTSTGVLLRYLLPPGSGSLHSSNLGERAQERTVSTLWGWSRHEWGDFHYYIALGFMAVLAFHLVLHWRWIVCVTRGKPAKGSGHRLALGTFGLIGALLLAAAPLIGPVQQSTRREIQNDHATESVVSEEHRLRGDMTLTEIAEATQVTTSYLIEQFSLPKNVALDENVGRLRQRHNFTMQQLRDAVAEWTTTSEASEND